MQSLENDKTLLVAVDSFFNPLRKKDNEEQYKTLLRNKSSFVSLISKDDFITKSLKGPTKSLYRTILEYVLTKFKAWVASFYGTTYDHHFVTASELALQERDYFETAYKIIENGEEYDLDNIII